MALDLSLPDLSEVSLLSLLSPLVLSIGAYATWNLVKFIKDEYFINPLADLPGPRNPSFLYGHLREIWDAENSVLHERWVEKYGKTIRYHIALGLTRFYTTDLKALNHILMNAYKYQKPESSRIFLSNILGNGVLVVEGVKHKQQRRIMNPAFGAAQIRELTEIYVEKALELRDVWAAEIKESKISEETGTNSARINVLPALSKMTLDVIGLAGFNYKFDGLSGKRNELNEAFNVIFNPRPIMTVSFVLRELLGRFQFLMPAKVDKETNKARHTMEKIATQLLQESKTALKQDPTTQKERRRDLLSLLVKANMESDIPEDQRMSDEDVLAQVPTFLVAGHETTSNTTAWALHALSQNPAIQSKLREELFTVSTDNPSMDELNALPYLDAVVRETLRVHTPVPATLRVAVEDDLVPLDTPFVDKSGVVRDSILIRKGQTLMIPILAINRAKDIWGEDAKEFRPERWESLPKGPSAIPGIWGNMLTFSGGPRACIGYRFSIVEIKALLFTLVRAFDFGLDVSAGEIGKKSSIVLRPILVKDPEAGSQMPLILTPHVHVY